MEGPVLTAEGVRDCSQCEGGVHTTRATAFRCLLAAGIYWAVLSPNSIVRAEERDTVVLAPRLRVYLAVGSSDTIPGPSLNTARSEATRIWASNGVTLIWGEAPAPAREHFDRVIPVVIDDRALGRWREDQPQDALARAVFVGRIHRVVVSAVRARKFLRGLLSHAEAPPTLIVVLEHRPGVDGEAQLRARLRLAILADVVAHPVGQRADGNQRIDRDRLIDRGGADGWWNRRRGRHACAPGRSFLRAGRLSPHHILR